MRSSERSAIHGQRGQALVLFALLATAIVGMIGLVVDGGNLQENRRQLQNAADAAAFAAIQDLPTSPSTATTDSLQWLTKNGSGSTEVLTNQVSTTNFPNDTITVKLQRTVSYFLAQVLGGSSANVQATATVTMQTITGMFTSDSTLFPYAVWDTDTKGNQHKVGDIVPFRSDRWVDENVPSNSSNWPNQANSFKGYLSDVNPTDLAQVNDGDTVSGGTGNDCGREPISALQDYYNRGEPIILPLIDSGSGNGSNLRIHVIGFVTLQLTVPNQSINKGCGKGDFLGEIVDYPTSHGKTGGTTSQTWINCGTGIGACKAVLTQ